MENIVFFNKLPKYFERTSTCANFMRTQKLSKNANFSELDDDYDDDDYGRSYEDDVPMSPGSGNF